MSDYRKLAGQASVWLPTHLSENIDMLRAIRDGRLVVVPAEPTEAMLAASRWSGSADISIQEEWGRREVWNRMIAAAQEET